MIGLISKEKSIQDEAGASSLSDEDAKKYSDYLETINTPEGHSAWVKNERKRRQSLVKKYGNVTDETVDKLDKDIAEKLCGPGKKTCKKYAKLKTAHDQTVVEFEQYRNNVKEEIEIDESAWCDVR